MVSIKTKAAQVGANHPNERGVDTLLIARITQAPLFRFLAIGGAAFVLDAGVVWGLTQVGISPYLARLASICLSIAFTFTLNRTWTFAATGPVTWVEFTAYVGASGIGMAINYAVYAGALKLGLIWLPALALGTIVAAAINFFAYGRIFKKP